MIASAENRELIKLPVAQVSADREERITEAVLAPNGDVSARIEERATGEAAARELRLYHHASATEYKQAIEQRIVRGVQGAVVSKIEPADRGAEFRLAIEFTAPHYAQSMMGRLLVFKPAMVARRESLPLGDTGRSVYVKFASLCGDGQGDAAGGFQSGRITAQDRIGYAIREIQPALRSHGHGTGSAPHARNARGHGKREG